MIRNGRISRQIKCNGDGLYLMEKIDAKWSDPPKFGGQ